MTTNERLHYFIESRVRHIPRDRYNSFDDRYTRNFIEFHYSSRNVGVSLSVTEKLTMRERKKNVTFEEDTHVIAARVG